MMGRRRAFSTGLTLCIALLLQLAAAARAMPEYNAEEIPVVADDELICFTLYTTHEDILKLTAQFYPLRDEHDRTAALEVKRDGEWEKAAGAEILDDGWTATFRVENWDMSKNAAFRVVHSAGAVYEGIIRSNPVDKDEIVVAAFTGNSVKDEQGGNIPKTDIVANINKVDPDMLFFSGDQVYNHFNHLKYWLRFGRDFGDITRNRPTVTIPDDHDVGQANLWGEGGKKCNSIAGETGGYYAPLDYVKQVERAQTSHLPDPYDPTPVKRGIGVYYTDINVGGVCFAIIEDRKFKTGPYGRVPALGFRPDLVTFPNYNPKELDPPGTEILGERQLKFLREWGADWRGCQMKSVLSQTIFAGAATHHGGPHQKAYADYDSNGWPKSARERALREIRKSFSFMLAGDQHLGTVVHHGVEDWNDSGYSFSVPSIANYYLRYWMPREPGRNREPGAPEYTGEFFDGFRNRLTMIAAANPDKKLEDNHVLTTRAAGFGIVRFDKKTREITIECWPRNTEVVDNPGGQYPGWPVTISQFDNYSPAAAAPLPELNVTGMEDPVVQLIDEESGDIVYTVRINGSSWRPFAFPGGTYTLKVGSQEAGGMKSFSGLETLEPGESETIDVVFE